ncbi:MAG: ABC transporter permease [Chloroflexi bacterium]|nr:ABC transporter permease [Chloroflexota bacterium]
MTVSEIRLRNEPLVIRSGTLRKYLTATHIAAAVGMFLIAGFVLTAVLAPLISPYDPTERVGRPFSPPSAEHAFGTNDIGQDILSELIHGTRISLIVGVFAGSITVLIGLTVGILAGYFPLTGRWLMRVTDIVLILPFLPLLIILSAYIGRGIFNTILVIGLLVWAGTARVIRGQVLTISQQDYVMAARSLGARDGYILLRYILPQVILLAIGEFVQATSAAILLEASLSFLGLGDPIQKSWGTVLYWAQVRGAFLSPAWVWWVLPPGILISLTTLGFALVGFSLEQYVNPRLRKR